MPPHLMTPADVRLVRWVQDAQISCDAKRVAWCETALDLERDEPVSNIMVAPADGTGEPRRFTDGPHDAAPRWSPDGRYLAYLSASDGPPALCLAPLEGGTPIRVSTPGAVRSADWSPTGDRLVLVVNVVPAPENANDPKTRNKARAVRGVMNRLEGEGWYEGRHHLFVYDVNAGVLRQIASGEFDEAQPSWSPDGSSIIFVSDRSPQRDDRLRRADIWEIPATGGRPHRLIRGIGNAQFPIFSPDGGHIAFTGLLGAEQQTARDPRVFVVTADGKNEPEQLAADLDRPAGFSFSGVPLTWLSPDELAFTTVEEGTIAVRRSKLGERSARPVVAGDTQVTGITTSRQGESPVLSYVSAWVDSPAEVFCLELGNRGRPPVKVSRAGDELLGQVELLPTERLTARAPDGTEVEYFVLRPGPGRAKRRGPKLPLLLEIHGGPDLYNPFSELFPYYQCLAGAGYVVVLPNPRGSIGYGEAFTKPLRGHWGEADLADVLGCADDVIERGLVDPGRQFVGGYSYGGFMTAWVVGHTDRFKAAAVGAPVIDTVSIFATSDVSVFLADWWAADPWSSPEAMARQSPLSFAPNVKTPVLLYVNEGDLRCPPGQADEFYAALKWLGKEVEYVRFPGGSHLSFFPMFGAPSQSQDRLTILIEFLGRHGGER